MKKIVIIEKDCDHWKFNSNINEVIRAVLNFLFFFFMKKFCHTKSTKRIKSTKRRKRIKGTKITKITKITKVQKAPKSTKSSKKRQKHKKHQKAEKRNQAKVKNAYKWTKIKNVLKKHLSAKRNLFTYLGFCVFWACAEKKRKKRRKVLQWKCAKY